MTKRRLVNTVLPVRHYLDLPKQHGVLHSTPKLSLLHFVKEHCRAGESANMVGDCIVAIHHRVLSGTPLCVAKDNVQFWDTTA